MKLFADLIDAFRHAEGPPPNRLWPFMAWALEGAFPAVGIALAVSLVVGASEVVSAALVYHQWEAATQAESESGHGSDAPQLPQG